MATNVFFVYMDGRVVPYDSRIHRSLVDQFLLWKSREACVNSLLIAGDRFDHRDLKKTFSEHSDYNVPDQNPDGAGNCFQGKITGWHSTGFDVQTRQSLKPLIVKVLGVRCM